MTELQGLNGHEELAPWAHQRLPAKNTLTTEDAAVIEKAYLAILDASPEIGLDQLVETKSAKLDSNPATHETTAPNLPSDVALQSAVADQTVVPIRKTNRQRSKAHLRFVASQPCLICQKSPCDAHHLKFAQPRSLGMKVSDEFTVPLCRRHHQELHRHGNEAAWWANGQLAPLEIAKELWDITSSDHVSSTRRSRSATSLDEAST